MNVPHESSVDSVCAPTKGELHVAMHPRAVLDLIREEVDELHAWHGGGIAFGRKPFLGEIRRNTFRVRTLSIRRDGAVGFLVGEVEPAEGGSLVRYRLETPSGFVRSLPFAAVAPAALFGIGGYLAAPVLFPEAIVSRVALVVACVLAGVAVAVVVIAVVKRSIRSDEERLLGFVREKLERP